MFIRTESTSDPGTMKFLPGERVMPSGSAAFADAAAAARSPLARRLFEVDGVAEVFLDAEAVTVGKAASVDWDAVRPAVLLAISAHYGAGAPVFEAGEAAEDDEVTARIRELIDTRIKPTAEQQGGDVALHGFKDGIVYLELTGRAAALRDGIENMLRHYVPEVTELRDWRDALSRPGLKTPEGVAIEAVLRDEVNPSVASHGGRITLIDVKDGVAYIRLEGGCQGCGMAQVTLKQGVETAILRAAPAISKVLDVTDHADGSNPYFQSGAAGASPF